MKRVSVASGTDVHTLTAVCKARDENIAESVVVGDESVIRKTAEENALDLHSIDIINVPDPVKAAYRAVEEVSSEKAHVFMKGYLHSDDFLRTVLDKEIGPDSVYFNSLGHGRTGGRKNGCRCNSRIKVVFIDINGIAPQNNYKQIRLNAPYFIQGFFFVHELDS